MAVPRKKKGASYVAPICAWSDDGSAATVSDDGRGTQISDPGEYDLKALAARTDRIRQDVRERAG